MEIKSEKLSLGENFLENLKDSIKKTLLLFRSDKEEFAIMQRNQVNKFVHIFGDSLFAYAPGVILIERFYKKEKCNNKSTKVKSLSDEDKRLISEFNAFATNMPISVDTTEEERAKYEKQIKEYQDKIKKITPEIKVLEKLHFKDIPLCELKDIPEEQIDILSSMYAAFCVSYISFVSWNSMNNMVFGLTILEDKEYYDLILIPMIDDK